MATNPKKAKNPAYDNNPSVATRFKKGNNFWARRSSFGRAPEFATPADLEQACMEYIEEAANNPIISVKNMNSGGDIKETAEPRMRAMSIGGLVGYLDISLQSWTRYRKNPVYSDICARVDNIIRTYKFEGAAADLLNASIIARDLGLADKKEVAGDPDAPLQIQTTDMTDKELARRLAYLLTQGTQDDD